MKLIAHRINSINELLSTDPKYGVEVDIRSLGEHLIIHHEPFANGEPFAKWLEEYKHNTLILNVKEEGLETQLIKLMAEKGIDDFFFLDQSFPFLVKGANLGERRSAVRVSEFESVETALTLAGKVDWIWVDCFTRFPLSHKDALLLKQAGFKFCIVSPELQGHSAEYEIPLLFNLLNELRIAADAICTKRIDIWEKLFISNE
jgi:hypothetical protein